MSNYSGRRKKQNKAKVQRVRCAHAIPAKCLGEYSPRDDSPGEYGVKCTTHVCRQKMMNYYKLAPKLAHRILGDQ